MFLEVTGISFYILIGKYYLFSKVIKILSSLFCAQLHTRLETENYRSSYADNYVTFGKLPLCPWPWLYYLNNLDGFDLKCLL